MTHFIIALIGFIVGVLVGCAGAAFYHVWSDDDVC
jgi:hypothetical protein